MSARVLVAPNRRCSRCGYPLVLQTIMPAQPLIGCCAFGVAHLRVARALALVRRCAAMRFDPDAQRPYVVEEAAS